MTCYHSITDERCVDCQSKEIRERLEAMGMTPDQSRKSIDCIRIMSRAGWRIDSAVSALEWLALNKG